MNTAESLDERVRDLRWKDAFFHMTCPETSDGDPLDESVIRLISVGDKWLVASLKAMRGSARAQEWTNTHLQGHCPGPDVIELSRDLAATPSRMAQYRNTATSSEPQMEPLLRRSSDLEDEEPTIDMRATSALADRLNIRY